MSIVGQTENHATQHCFHILLRYG